MFGDIFGGTAYKSMPFYIQKLNKVELDNDLAELLDRLESRTGTTAYNRLFKQAFSYFIARPEQYDGASGDQELDIITKVIDINGKPELVRLRYDINSIIHDYLDAVGMTYDFDRMQLSNRLFDKMNHEMGISYWNREKRKLVAMPIVSKFRIWMRKRKKVQHTPNEAIYKVQESVTKLVGNHSVSFRFLKMFSIGTALIAVCLVYLIII